MYCLSCSSAAAPITGVSPRTQDILRGLPAEERAGLVEPPPLTVPQKAAQRRAAEEEAEAVTLGVGEIPPFPTESAPSGFRWAFDKELNRWIPKFMGAPTPPGISPFQQQQLDFQQQQFEAQQSQAQQEEAFRQQQLQFQQEQAQLAAEEQERQYKSQLAANPINWLQYSAYTGEEPVIQPWMVPLGFQNVGGDVTPQGLQAGQPIPGFEGQAGQKDTQTFAGLPRLTTPSAQLQARWGPTAASQFLGYRQARTGASPEETQFRLSSGRAPTGRFGGFSRFR